MNGLDRRGREIREEIRFHLEERARELEGQGLSPEDARRRAAEKFGDVEELDRACPPGRVEPGAGAALTRRVEVIPAESVGSPFLPG